MRLTQLIKSDKDLYKSENVFLKRVFNILIRHNDYYIYKTIVYSRYYQYYKEKNKKLKALYFGRKYFKNAQKCNLELYAKLGEKIKIYHPNIVINKNACIGNNVKLHGNNCIGNNGYNDKAPTIGNNVDIGFGTCIIGDVSIADDIVIGANSVVTKSFSQKGIVIAGNPAKIIKTKSNEK